MLVVIKEREIYFPEYMVSAHNQGVKNSRDRYYNDFIFIAFNEIGNLGFIHHQFKSFRAHALASRDTILGLHIDIMGAVNLVKTRVSIKNSDGDEEGTQLVSTPMYFPIDVPVNDVEWNVVAEYPAMHDYCAALLHHGIPPGDAIAKTLAAMGHPNNNKISVLAIKDIVKDLAKTYSKSGTPSQQDILFDLIREPIKLLK